MLAGNQYQLLFKQQQNIHNYFIILKKQKLINNNNNPSNKTFGSLAVNANKWYEFWYQAEKKIHTAYASYV